MQTTQNNAAALSHMLRLWPATRSSSIGPWDQRVDRQGCLGGGPDQISKDHFVSRSLEDDRRCDLVVRM